MLSPGRDGNHKGDGQQLVDKQMPHERAPSIVWLGDCQNLMMPHARIQPFRAEQALCPTGNLALIAVGFRDLTTRGYGEKYRFAEMP